MGKRSNQSNAGSKFALIFGAIWLVLSVPFILAGVHMLNMEQRYESEGVAVSGSVDSKRIEERRERDRDTKQDRITKSYYVKYKFPVPGNDQVFEGEDTVESNVWEGLSTDSPIQIQYLRTEPSSNRVAHEPQRFGGIMFCLFGTLSLMIGIFSIGYVFKKKKLIKNLMQNGMLIDGVISKVYASTLTINNERQWRFDYTYKDLKGGQYTGRSDYMSPEAATAYKTGMKGRVRYDQNKPQKSIWVGDKIAS